MKRTQLKRKTPIRRASNRKLAEIRQRKTLRAQLADERGWRCEVCRIHEWTQMHEKRLRSQGGDPLDPDNVLCLCANCHRWIHDHPAKAARYGWLVRR